MSEPTYRTRAPDGVVVACSTASPAAWKTDQSPVVSACLSFVLAYASLIVSEVRSRSMSIVRREERTIWAPVRTPAGIGMGGPSVSTKAGPHDGSAT
jgi:hypothetical protein